VPLHALDPGCGHAVAVAAPPAPHDGRHQPRLYEVGDTPVGEAGVVGVRAGEARSVIRPPTLVLPARLESALVGVRPAHDLHHAEPLALPVGGQLLEALPRHPLAQVLPPGVAEPDKRRSIGVLEAPVVGGHADRPVTVERIAGPVGRHLESPFDPVQPGVAVVRALGTPDVPPGDGRSVSEAPEVAPRPERGHPQRRAVRRGDEGVHLGIHEWVVVGLGRYECDLGDVVGLHRGRVGLQALRCARQQRCRAAQGGPRREGERTVSAPRHSLAVASHDQALQPREAGHTRPDQVHREARATSGPPRHRGPIHLPPANPVGGSPFDRLRTGATNLCGAGD